MRRINPNIHPKDGFWFKDSDGVRITADTWAGVIVRTVAYRKRAGYPPGDPANEVIEQACARNPILCNDDNSAHEVLVRKASLKSRVLAWMQLARMHKKEGRLQFVPEELAQARADICAKCPLNTSLQEGCHSCRAALQEMRNEVLGRRRIDPRIHACLELEEDLPTAAHLERESVPRAELPDHCWRKRQI